MEHRGPPRVDRLFVRLASRLAGRRCRLVELAPDLCGQPEKRRMDGHRDAEKGLDGFLLSVHVGARGLDKGESALDRDLDVERAERGCVRSGIFAPPLH